MKLLNVIFVTLLTLISATAQKTIVTGSIKYGGYDFLPGETFTLNYQNVSIQCNVDSFSAADIRRLLVNCSIPDSLIKYIAAYGNSTTDIVEAFFAYEGAIKNSSQTSDINIDNKYHRKTSGYGTQGGLIVPTYNYIISDSLRNVVKLIAYQYPIRSFYVAWTLNELPFIVLANGSTNGTLADMRNTRNSYRLVPYFKEANFQIIHYRDEQNVWKTIRRPAKGW